ncbi:MAG: hypothetical protein AB8F34_11460 [Akkermansiaceae bacterium]
MKDEQNPLWQLYILSYACLKKVNWLVVIISALISQSAFAQETTIKKLPSDSQHLIDRLAEYEQRENDKLKKILNKKRGEVLTILRKHFKFRTKNGQLDQALAIRKEITRIEALLPQATPKRLLAVSKQYQQLGKALPASQVPSYFEIDADEKMGKISLQFSHPQLDNMLEESKKVELELQINKNVPYAGSIHDLVIKHGIKVIGRHSKPKAGELVKIPLDTWKIVRPGRTLKLSIENSGIDKIGFRTDGKEDFAALIFTEK